MVAFSFQTLAWPSCFLFFPEFVSLVLSPTPAGMGSAGRDPKPHSLCPFVTANGKSLVILTFPSISWLPTKFHRPGLPSPGLRPRESPQALSQRCWQRTLGTGMVNAEGQGRAASVWYTFQATLLRMVTRSVGDGQFPTFLWRFSLLQPFERAIWKYRRGFE